MAPSHSISFSIVTIPFSVIDNPVVRIGPHCSACVGWSVRGTVVTASAVAAAGGVSVSFSGGDSTSAGDPIPSSGGVDAGSATGWSPGVAAAVGSTGKSASMVRTTTTSA